MHAQLVGALTTAMMKARLGSEGFTLKRVDPDHDAVGEELLIVAAGFLTQSGDVCQRWKELIRFHPRAEIYAVDWECQMPSDFLKSAGAYVVGGAATLIANPWGKAKNRAEACGKALAEFLSSPLVGGRPVTLAGHSLGGRMMFFALKALRAYVHWTLSQETGQRELEM